MNISIENRARLAFALVIVSALVAGLVWYYLSSSQYTTYQIRTQDAVSGLIADAPVEFHGVEVGKVKRVELSAPHSVSVLLNIDRDVPITAATVATITARGLATRGFMGYVYVALEDPGTDASPLLATPGSPYPLIRTAPSHSVNLDNAISQVNQNVQALTELMRSVLDKKTITSLKLTLDNLQQVSAMLEENNKKLSAIILNSEQASQQLQPLLQSSSDAVKTLQQQILPEAYKTLNDLDRLSGTLNGVAGKINRDPSIILRGSTAPAPGPGETK
jgi:phospholipid/cholesterol/gamma-HCH transport system substrate-binding protein